jgi:hypothetical protein
MNGVPVDTFNKFFVGVLGPDIVVGRAQPRMSKADALLLAAYLVALAEEAPGEFARVLVAVRST